MLDSFCFAEFVSCYALIYKPKEVDQTYDYQPDALPYSLLKAITIVAIILKSSS